MMLYSILALTHLAAFAALIQSSSADIAVAQLNSRSEARGDSAARREHQHRDLIALQKRAAKKCKKVTTTTTTYAVSSESVSYSTYTSSAFKSSTTCTTGDSSSAETSSTTVTDTTSASTEPSATTSSDLSTTTTSESSSTTSKETATDTTTSSESTTTSTEPTTTTSSETTTTTTTTSTTLSPTTTSSETTTTTTTTTTVTTTPTTTTSTTSATPTEPPTCVNGAQVEGSQTCGCTYKLSCRAFEDWRSMRQFDSPDYLACLESCDADPNCGASEFRPELKRCLLYDAAGISNVNSGDEFIVAARVRDTCAPGCVDHDPEFDPPPPIPTPSDCSDPAKICGSCGCSYTYLEKGVTANSDNPYYLSDASRPSDCLIQCDNEEGCGVARYVPSFGVPYCELYTAAAIAGVAVDNTLGTGTPLWYRQEGTCSKTTCVDSPDDKNPWEVKKF